MTRTDDNVALHAALDPLVLALDIGSTATRGGVHDASGRRVRGLQHKVLHAFTVAPDGTSVIDPGRVTTEVGQVIDAVTADRRLGTRIATFPNKGTTVEQLVGAGVLDPLPAETAP